LLLISSNYRKPEHWKESNKYYISWNLILRPNVIISIKICSEESSRLKRTHIGRFIVVMVTGCLQLWPCLLCELPYLLPCFVPIRS
jgi:hypothetical protein